MSNLLKIRIYYEDTDAGGFVYYANYLKFAERGRTELLRSAGFENKTLMENEGVVFVVRHVAADYLKPALLDDHVVIKTTVTKVKKASVQMHQSLFRHNDEDNENLLFSMDVTLACIDTNTLKPVGFSEDIKAAFQKFLKE